MADNAQVTNHMVVSDGSPSFLIETHANEKLAANGVDVEQDKLSFANIGAFVTDAEFRETVINPHGGDIRLFNELATFNFAGDPVWNHFISTDNPHHSTDLVIVRQDGAVTFLERPGLP